MPANMDNSPVNSPVRTGKGQFSFQSQKGNARGCSDYGTIVVISHGSKVMLKILQARLQQYVNPKLPDVQAKFRKGRGTRDQIASIHWILEKAREFQRNICFIDYTKAFDCVKVLSRSAAAAAAKLPQSCPTLGDPIDGSPLGSSVPGILQARTLEWVAIRFSSA